MSKVNENMAASSLIRNLQPLVGGVIRLYSVHQVGQTEKAYWCLEHLTQDTETSITGNRMIEFQDWIELKRFLVLETMKHSNAKTYYHATFRNEDGSTEETSGTLERE